MYEVRKIPEQRRNRLYLYFKNKLQSIGYPDRYLLSTADNMVKKTLEILMLEVEE